MFDGRLLRVGIEIEGQFNLYEDFNILVNGSKFASETQNETEIQISNLDQQTRDFLLTEGTPFNRVSNRVRPRIFVEAGRESYGFVRVFEGDITTVSVSQPPDITLTINALTSQFGKGSAISVSSQPMDTLSNIAAQAANTLGVGISFEAEDMQIGNYRYDGTAAGQVANIAELTSKDVFVDDDVLVVKERNQPLQGRRIVLSRETGLVGIPQFDAQGINVQFLFDGQSTLGTEIEIRSELYPAANGLYVIFRLDFSIANRDTPFYYTAKARPIR